MGLRVTYVHDFHHEQSIINAYLYHERITLICIDCFNYNATGFWAPENNNFSIKQGIETFLRYKLTKPFFLFLEMTWQM